MDECAIETSGHADVKWLCVIWKDYPDDRSAMVCGFLLLSMSTDKETREELMFLQSVAHQLEADEAGHGYH